MAGGHGGAEGELSGCIGGQRSNGRGGVAHTVLDEEGRRNDGASVVIGDREQELHVLSPRAHLRGGRGDGGEHE